MNKAIIAGICGFVAGVAGGYFGCHFIEQKKIDKKISDEVQRTLDEIRNGQKQKIMENEEKKSNIINAIPHFNAVDIAKDIAKENGYAKKEEEEQKEPEGKPDDDSDLPFEVGEVEKHNVWDMEDEEPDVSPTQEEYDAEQEPDKLDISKYDPKKAPYPITKEQYDEELIEETSNGLWDKVDLIFFTDNVFAERASFNEFTTMSSTEIELAIGKDNMKRFIEDRSLGIAYVRNNKLRIDYNIIRSPRSYSSAMHEDDEE